MVIWALEGHGYKDLDVSWLLGGGEATRWRFDDLICTPISDEADAHAYTLIYSLLVFYYFCTSFIVTNASITSCFLFTIVSHIFHNIPFPILFLGISSTTFNTVGILYCAIFFRNIFRKSFNLSSVVPFASVTIAATR
jgi:hypothetical protein